MRCRCEQCGAAVNNRTQAYLLLLFGGALLRLGLSDLLLRYVRPAARIWVLLAGLALLSLAIGRLVQAHRARLAGGPAIRTGWLLVAPVVAILIVTPSALGSFSAVRAPIGVPSDEHKDFPALTGPAPHQLGMLDFTTRVLWDAGRTVAGQNVQLTGFVLAGRPDGFVLARLVITCCAADARPVEVEIRADQAPARDTWLRVTGRYAGVDPAQSSFPVLTATSVTAIKQPTNPYD